MSKSMMENPVETPVESPAMFSSADLLSSPPTTSSDPADFMDQPATPATIVWPITIMVVTLVGWVGFTELVIGWRQSKLDRQEWRSAVVFVEDDVPPMELIPPALKMKKVPASMAEMRMPETRMMASAAPAPVMANPVAPGAVAVPAMPGAAMLPQLPAKEELLNAPRIPEPRVLEERAVQESAKAEPTESIVTAAAAAVEPRAELLAISAPEPTEAGPVSVQRSPEAGASGTRKVSPLFRPATF